MHKYHPVENPENKKTQTRTLKDLVNTPFKKAMFVVQIISYILIVGSPGIGAVIGSKLDLDTAQTAGVILGIFIAGEVLFYGSLFFLGKELILIIKSKFRKLFKRKNKRDNIAINNHEKE
ncbi:MAG: hypothetical protein C0599_00780 [Salinivirgaceae bacterium]|nr:MAG: hypothetical protein C0599_00780 [Salinivirgaceae bacterium]